MSTTIKTGWLNDEQGNKFAPKTLTSQVQTNDGLLLEDKIQIDIEAAKTEILDKVALESIDIPIDDALSSISENPVQNKVISERFDAVSADMDVLEAAIDKKIDTATVSSVYETKSDAQEKYDNATAHSDANLEIAKSYTDTRLASIPSVDGYTKTEIDATVAVKEAEKSALAESLAQSEAANAELTTTLETTQAEKEELQNAVDVIVGGGTVEDGGNV